ncbi:(S)-benzoin forming benzil reductase [Peribacillus sp. SCS-155]|uniref:(S)-benzoin forming benzil reductase n=1 Tax=Peribacillus sedimenti TaxID=3115297 RepID=UPI003905E595
MKTFIITGASKGLGEALSRLSFSEDSHCILISRTLNQQLMQEAKNKGVRVTYLTFDIGDITKLPEHAAQIFESLHESSEIVFINNAGVVEPIKPAGKLELEQLEASMKINFLAPVFLNNEFLHRTASLKAKKVIVNISSGAAKNPYHGWGAYCSTKAGLEMFTRVAGLEQKREENPATVISFSPGKMDTDMQAEIRKSPEEDFADAALFNMYKEKGDLRTPEFVAEKLMHLLQKGDLENGEFYDIKTLI